MFSDEEDQLSNPPTTSTWIFNQAAEDFDWTAVLPQLGGDANVHH